MDERKVIMQEILINQIQTPDGTIIRSYHTHDFRMHCDKNGKSYSVDGGPSYLRRCGDNDAVDLSVLTHDPFEKIRLYWQPTIDKYLYELTTLEIWDRCERISYWDNFHNNISVSSREKERYVIETSLLLQERLFRQKYKNYCKQVRRTITDYKNQSLGFVEVGKLLAQKIWESEHPFGKIQRIYDRSKKGNRIYFRLVKLVKEWMDKHSFAKVSEYETEKVLSFILKPLEE